MKKVLFFSLLIIFWAFNHPFYLSVTDLKYNANEKALQGSVKLFINDLEEVLKKINKQPTDLLNPKDTIKTNKILYEYIKKRLLFKINGKPTSYDLIGSEKENEAIWLYIEAKNCPQPKTMEIENSLLYDFIKDQMNIVHMEVKGEKKSLKVNCPEKKLLFEFGS